MLRASDKKLIQRIVFGNIGLVVLLIVVAIFAKGTWSVYTKAKFAEENRTQAEQELEKLEEREAALNEELVRLNTQRGLEEEIRQKFDVGKEGEQMIVLVDAPDPEPEVVVEEPSIWERIVEIFGFR